MAAVTLANPARDTDRFKRVCAADIKPIRIDQRAGMRDLAPQRDRKARDWCAKASGRFGDVSRDRNLAHTIGRFGQLAQELPRCFKGTVYIPKRASATKAGKLQPRRGMAFGDGASLIDAHEKERHPICAGAL